MLIFAVQRILTAGWFCLRGQLWSRTKHTNQQPLSVEVSNAARLLSAVAMVVLLSACGIKEPPPVDNGFCLYVPLPDPADAVNLKVRGNKVAILTNEQNFQQWCRLGDRSKSMGPR